MDHLTQNSLPGFSLDLREDEENIIMSTPKHRRAPTLSDLYKVAECKVIRGAASLPIACEKIQAKNIINQIYFFFVEMKNNGISKK